MRHYQNQLHEMKNIAFCINSLNTGGAEILLIDQINNWPDGFKVYLILLSDNNTLIHRISIKDVEIIIVNKKTNLGRILSLRNFFKINTIDVCFSHLERSNKIVLLASLFTKTKAIPVVHSVNMYKTKTIKWFFTSLMYRQLTKHIIAVSAAVAQYLNNNLKVNKNKIIQIDNGIDFSRIKCNKAINESNDDSVMVFATLGRIEDAKGYDLLINALANGKLRNANWKLKMIGDGSKYNEICNLINSNNLKNKIELLGNQNNPFAFLNDVDFVLMPSRREGLPIALLEVLSLGIPVLASKAGGLPSVIKNNFNGLVIDDLNIDDIVLKIEEILSFNKDTIDRLSANALESVQYYNIENCINKYISLI